MALKKLAGETAIYGLSHILPRVLNFIIMTPYLTNKFSKYDYGIYSELYAYATIIISLMVFRMDTAYFRFATKSDKNQEAKVYSTTFGIMAFVSTLIVLTMLFWSDHIANFLGYHGEAYYVKWFAMILALDAYTTLIYGKFRLEERPMRFLFYRVLNVVINVILILFFLEVMPLLSPSFNEKISTILHIQKKIDYVFMSNLLASLFVFILMTPEFFKIKRTFDKKLMLDVLKYSFPLVIIVVAGNINQSIAVPLQNFWLEGSAIENKSMSGLYSGVSKLAIFLNLFTTAFNYAAEPFFFRQAAKDNKHQMNGVISKVFTIFSIIVILGTYFYLDFVLYLLGKEFRDATEIVPILLIAYLFLGLYYNFSIWYKLADKTKIGAYISISGVLITLILSFIFIPWLGIIGSAIACLICYIFEAFVCYKLGQKYFPIEYPIKSILKYVILASFLLFFSWIIRENVSSPFLRILLNTSLLMSYCLYIFVTEKSFINQYIYKK
ncbi:MAG: hypothetical protein RLZZ546_3159 [Bacteroidota bacterium]